MIRPTIFIAIAATVLTFGASVRSQSVVGARSPVQQLQTVKASNQLLLEKQAALLLKLDALQKEAAQIKFLAKRG